MRALIKLTLGVVLLAGSSCKKESGPSEIFGDWQWVSSSGGLTGKQVDTPASTNSTRTLTFTRDSMVVRCYNGQCEAPVRFTCRTERSFFTGEPALILTFRYRIYLALPDTTSQITLEKYTLVEVSKTLRINQESPDGFGEVYQRK